MDYHPIFEQIAKEFPELDIKENHPLAPYTTLRIGGPADIFIHVKSSSVFSRLLTYLAQNQIKDFTILGNGSNVLIADKGIRGIVIKNSDNSINILGNLPSTPPQASPEISVHRTESEPQKYLNFGALDYDESDAPMIQVEITSGTQLPFAINYLLDHQVTGLQWFAYIPGTIGGAIWYNIHGGKYHFSQFLESIKVFDTSTGDVSALRSTDLTWDYDQSYFQQHPNLIILSAVFNLHLGDTLKAKAVRDAWIAQKVKVQPMNSAGSVFKNPSLADCQRLWGEQKSTGWIIDHELNLKGQTKGNACIGPQHANIFTNQGSATASDFLALVNQVKDAAQSRFKLDLSLEVKLLGDFS